MLCSGILNPQLLSLLARVRHTNALVIADRGFPSFAGLETVDLSLVDDIPTVPEVLRAILQNFTVAEAFMAEEFLRMNDEERRARHLEAIGSSQLRIGFEPHLALKRRVPSAVGLVRTGDTVPYANIVLISG